MFEYNTNREYLKLREVGRNVQKLAKHLITIKDNEKRERYAMALIELMRHIVPSVNDSSEDTQRLWGDLHTMTEGKLDIDNSFNKAIKPLKSRPEKIKYNSHKIKFKHYGRNLELMVEETIKIKDEVKKQNGIIYIGRLMRSYHIIWNKEMMDDEVLVNNISAISGGLLLIDVNKVRENNLFDSLYKEKNRQSNSLNNRYKKNDNGSYKSQQQPRRRKP